MMEQALLHVERGLAHLQELCEAGIFTEERLRSIIRDRQKYEARLKRRPALLEDFCAYIDREKALEMERRDRLVALNLRNNQRSGQHLLVSHILSLYQRALVKFPGETSLWMELLEYCQMEGRQSAFAKNMARALQLHPRNPSLWIVAATHEWQSNGNMTAARAYFQRGLRLNSDSSELWVAFFGVEVAFVEKLRERREALGLVTGEGEDKDRDEDEDEGNAFTGAIAMVVLEHALESEARFTPDQLTTLYRTSLGLHPFLPRIAERTFTCLMEKYANSAPHIAALSKAQAEHERKSQREQTHEHHLSSEPPQA